jgi:hypothetical protein
MCLTGLKKHSDPESAERQASFLKAAPYNGTLKMNILKGISQSIDKSIDKHLEK